VTFAATQWLSGRRGRSLLLAALALGAAGVFAAPALAAPEFGITMTHLNAYGVQAHLCRQGKVELPGEPGVTEPCGINPLTEEKGDKAEGEPGFGKGETFARESGGNTYTITVKNTGSTETTAPVTVEDTLPAGMILASGASTARAAGTGWQCTLLPGGAVDGAYAEAECSTSETLASGASYPPIKLQVAVGPTPGASTVPANRSVNKATVSGGGAAAVKEKEETAVTEATPFGIDTLVTSVITEPQVGGRLTCAGGPPTGGVSLAYQWLRNGVAITGPPDATEKEYTVQSEDAGKVIQCLVTATGTNAGSAATSEPVPVTPAPATAAPSPPKVAAPIAAGLLTVGSTPSGVTLTCAAGAWTGGTAFSYQWYRNGVSLGSEHGATEKTYTVQSADLATAASFQCAVTDTNAGGSVTAFSGLKNTTPSPSPIVTATSSVSNALNNDFNEPLTEPFGQAGGHPFADFTEIVLNYTTGIDGKLVAAGGPPKEVEAELPPGFVGDVQNAPQCNVQISDLQTCPPDTAVGYTQVVLTTSETAERKIEDGKALIFPTAFGKGDSSLIYNLKPPHGSPAEFGFVVAEGVPFVLEAKVRSNGDYGATVGDDAVAEKPLAFRTTICANGATKTPGPSYHCNAAPPSSEPFLRNPTECTSSPLAWTAEVNPWYEPTDYQPKTSHSSLLTGCNLLQFPPETGIEFTPSPPLVEGGTNFGGTSQADEPTGVTVNLKVPQTNEASVKATPDIKNVKMTLPAGMTVSPSAANGLQACSNAQFGFEATESGALRPAEQNEKEQTEAQTGHFVPETPAKPALCPLASQIGTVEIVTPLLSAPLQGQLFVAEPECGNANYPEPCTPEYAEGKGGPKHNRSLFRLFLQAEDPSAGVIVKVHGFTSANTQTGQLTTMFEEQPQQPFKTLTVKLNGGPRATLANPQSCGTATTTADLTPWSTPFAADAMPTSSFNVEGCPATMPFGPSFNAGTAGTNATTAGRSTSFSLTFGRQDGEQDLSGITVHMPPGLTGKIAGIPLCGEAQANAGTCGPESEIGTATSLAGPGPDPFPEAGRVYLTGPYKGAPFGLSVVTPAVAGPFNLGNVVVRSAISINPYTAAVTVTSDPLPQFVDGVQLRLREVNVSINRPGFMLNPTNCSEAQVSATLVALQGASVQVFSPFGVGGCTTLPFKPVFTASTQGHTSKADGASLDVKVTYPQGEYANIAQTVTELPTALPSRLTTLQKACLDAVFEANPAACPEGSVVGYATAHTPLLNVPLSGPAYLVSHGGAAFPDLEVVLQGENVEVILDGQTDIKKGITKTTFNAVPDSPVETFELNLPEGPHSALSANVEPCSTPLVLPTVLTGQNGAVIKQTTKIAVTGCPPTVAITKTKLTGNILLVTVKTSAKGTVRISGKGLKAFSQKNLNAGTHQFRVALTKMGRSLRSKHEKVSVSISLTVGKQAVAKATTVRL